MLFGGLSAALFNYLMVYFLRCLAVPTHKDRNTDYSLPLKNKKILGEQLPLNESTKVCSFCKLSWTMLYNPMNLPSNKMKRYNENHLL